MKVREGGEVRGGKQMHKRRFSEKEKKPSLGLKALREPRSSTAGRRNVVGRASDSALALTATASLRWESGAADPRTRLTLTGEPASNSQRNSGAKKRPVDTREKKTIAPAPKAPSFEK